MKQTKKSDINADTGHCLRAPAQQACNYANICEHCPSFHTTIQDIPVLTRQRDIAATLANDAQHRGWDTETERHLKLITRLNNLIVNTTTRPNAEQNQTTQQPKISPD